MNTTLRAQLADYFDRLLQEQNEAECACIRCTVVGEGEPA